MDGKKAQLMSSVFGKNLDLVMKKYPMPKQPVKKPIENKNSNTTTTTTTTITTSTASSVESTTPTIETSN